MAILPAGMKATQVFASTSDYSGALDASLGDVVWIGDKAYKCVKTAAAISAATKKALVYTDTAGTTVNTTTTASNSKVAGVVPSDLVYVSSTAGQLDSGDYFLMQVAGKATTISAAAVADGAAVGTSTTAGKVDDATIAVGGVLGVALESAADADEDLEVLLKGLI